MSLTKADILSFGKAPKSSVEIDGATFHIRVMSGAERHKFFATFDDQETDSTAHLLVRCLSDDKGNRLFTDDEAAVLHAALPVTVQEDLAKEAIKVNRLSVESRKDAEKN